MISNIIFKQGDIFDSDCMTIVNPSNSVGIAGAGLSLIFKQRYPEAYREYMYWCNTKPKEGDISFSATLELDPITNKRHNVLHLSTKYQVYHNSSLELIKMGLDSFLNISNLTNSIAFPSLGCGLGGLSFDDVKPIMVEYLSKLDYPVEIYLPQ